jgi:hypothetical protein
MDQISRHRSGMGEQCNALSRQRFSEFGVCEQAIDAELHRLSL